MYVTSGLSTSLDSFRRLSNLISVYNRSVHVISQRVPPPSPPLIKYLHRPHYASSPIPLPHLRHRLCHMVHQVETSELK